MLFPQDSLFMQKCWNLLVTTVLYLELYCLDIKELRYNHEGWVTREINMVLEYVQEIRQPSVSGTRVSPVSTSDI
jgi:hypothetical protein